MSGKQRLLIVDDEQFNRELLALMFEESEFDTVEATDGEDALRKLADCPCDAMVVDWMMPKMNGIQLLKAMKADPRYSNIPVIMQTARGNAANVKEALDAGAYAYVVKPYEASAIMRVVKDALSPVS